MIKKFNLILVVFILLASMFVFWGKPLPANAAVCGGTGILYVNLNNPTPVDGCSWGTAFNTLQDALEVAVVPSNGVVEIWTAAGVYYPDQGVDVPPADPRSNTFTLVNGVSLYGGFSGVETERSQRNPTTYVTILSGDIGVAGNAFDNAYHVVTAGSLFNVTVLDGFTIQGGRADSGDDYGGGLYISLSNGLQLRNLTFTANYAGNGGGLAAFYSDLVMEQLIFTGNSARQAGGGIFTHFGNPVLDQATFDGNIAVVGGGFYALSASPVISNVTFTNNQATADAGGGMHVTTPAYTDPPLTPLLTHVVFRNNRARGGGGLFLGNTNGGTRVEDVTFDSNTAIRRGGAVLLEYAVPTFVNVTFTNNTSQDDESLPQPRGGGAIMSIDSNPILVNVTFSGNNSLLIGGDAIRNASGDEGTGSFPVIYNSILWDVDDEITTYDIGGATISDSIVRGGCPAGATCTNVINSDPLLGALQDNGGFTQTMAITTASPAWNTGSNASCAPTDQRGVARPQGYYCDMGAYEVEIAYPFLAAPVGALTSWTNAFRWASRSDANDYQLEVYDDASGVRLFKQWFTSAQAGCNTDTACDISPAALASLPNGSYRWRIQDHGAYGYGAWSPYTYFSLNAACYTLTTAVSPIGSGTVNPSAAQNCPGGYVAGTVLQLTAAPAAGFSFVSWSGDASGTTNPVSVTMNANLNVTANLRGVTLIAPANTLTAWDNTFLWDGAMGATSYQLEVYDDTSGVRLLKQWYTAAATGCDADSSCTVSPASLASLANGNYRWRIQHYGAYGYGPWTPYAYFTLNAACYTLTTTVNPIGSGTVNASPVQNCPGGYVAGTVVQLTAAPATGYAFANWSGDASGTTNPVSVTMNANLNVTANLRGVTLISPASTVNTWNNVFSWTGFPEGLAYQLEVYNNDTGVRLHKWWYTAANAGCTTDTSCQVSPSALASLANGSYRWRIQDYGAYGYGPWTPYTYFTLNAACYTLTTTVNPIGSGTVNASPVQNCPGGYVAGTVVQLTAAPVTGYAFANWSGDASGTTNPVSVTMNANLNVTANLRGVTLIAPVNTLTAWDNTFSWNGLSGALNYQLEVYDDTSGVRLLKQWFSAAETNCSSDTSCQVSPSALASLANGSYRWRVQEFGPYGYGAWSPYTYFTLNAACYTLTTAVNPPGSGTVNVGTAQNCTGGYLAGTVVQLTAAPATGFAFASWSGDASGTTNPVSVTMNANLNVTANLRGVFLLAPEGTLTTWDETFYWTGFAEAAQYQLEVYDQTSGVRLFKQWFTAAAAACNTDTSCQVTPSALAGLANGNYRWRIQDYGAYGYGPWSQYLYFTLNR